MGALVTREGRLEIVEYTEIDPALKPCYSYVGMTAFTLPFMKKMAQIDLPLHWVWKKAGERFGLDFFLWRYFFHQFNHHFFN